LKTLSATDLATVATKAALSSGNIDPALVDSVYVGNVIQSSADAAYLARHVGLVSPNCGVFNAKCHLLRMNTFYFAFLGIQHVRGVLSLTIS
jgi:hypothetical protein